jgi:hypothetical protein
MSSLRGNVDPELLQAKWVLGDLSRKSVEPQGTSHKLKDRNRSLQFLSRSLRLRSCLGLAQFTDREAIIVAHENVRKRLLTKQTPYWSQRPIGPSPERGWPIITFRDMITGHFAGEDIEMDHYANAHSSCKVFIRC